MEEKRAAMTDTNSERISLAFLERFWADRDAGRTVGLADYLRLFPDHVEVVAREYLSATDDAKSAEPPATEEGRLGQYRLLKELGRGGQGVVWLAEDLRLGRRVALKVLTGLGPGAESQLARFKREAAVASKLDHPAICGVHDAGIESGVPYIAMRYVAGTTLAEMLVRMRSATAVEEGSFVVIDGEDPPPTAPSRASKDSAVGRAEMLRLVTAFERVASALHAAPEAGVVHRDITPGTIMVTATGEAVLLDFGLAHDGSDAAGPSLTQTGDLFGTPAYMSPEQITGRRVRIDRRSDVYSLGVTLYECLTLKRPFEAATREALYQAILTKEPELPRKLNRAIPPDLEVVLQCAMSKDRDRRYQSAADFAEDLRRVREGDPIVARKVTALGRAWRWSKRRPAAASLLLALALGVPTVSGLGVWWWRHREDVRAQSAARVEELVEDQLEIGYFESYHGDSSVAVDAFRRALSLDDSSVEAWAGLAFAYMNLRRSDDALRALDDGLAAVANPRALHRTKAEILERLGRRAESLALLAEAPEVRGPQMWFLEGLRELDRAHSLPLGRLSSERFDRAAKLLVRAVLTAPRPRRAYLFGLVHAVGHDSDPETTAIAAETLTHLWPDSGVALYWASFATLMTDPLRSVEAARRSIEVDPRNALGRYALANAYARSGKLKEATDAIREGLSAMPDNKMLRQHLGAFLNRQGRRGEAVAAFEDALRQDPDDAGVRLGLGNALLGAGKVEEALAVFAECRRLFPDDQDGHLSYGAILCDRLKRYPEAEAAFRDAVRASTATSSASSTAYQNLGIALQRQGKLDEAVAALRECLRIDPDDDDARSTLASSLQGLRSLGEAEAVLREGLRLAPNSLRLRLDLGGLLCDDLGRPHESEEQFREALRIDPLSAHARGCLGTALSRQDRLDEAVEAYREALRLDPSNVHSLMNLAGILCDKLGSLDEAEAMFREVLRLQPDNVHASVNLGNALGAQGRPAAAAEVWRAALERDPNLPGAAGFRASIAAAAEREAAMRIPVLREAVADDPEDVDALNNLAWRLAALYEVEGRDLPESLRLARKAAALSARKSVRVLDTLAVALTLLGDLAGAVGVREEIVALMDGKDRDGVSFASMKYALERARRELATKSGER